MKPVVCIFISLALLLFHAGCQKEVTGIVAGNTPVPTDSTGIDPDSTGTTTDSLTILSFSPDSGRIGTEVRITGSGFDTLLSANAVLLNTTLAPVIRATKTALTIQVPQGSTTGRLSVTVNGKTARSTGDFVVLADSVTNNNDGVWVRKADFPSVANNTFVTGFAVNNMGYFLKGLDLWAYDPEKNYWSQKSSVPSASGKSYGFHFVIGDKAYIGLGAAMPGEVFTGGNNYNEVWEYNSAQDSWTQKADFPGLARVAPFSFSIDGTGYMGGGDTSNANLGATADFWKYNPATDTWTPLAPFPGTATIGLAAFGLSGSGYVLGAGAGNPTAPVLFTTTAPLWKYDPATDRWTEQARFAVPGRSIISAVAFTIGNKGYAAFGLLDESNPDNSTKDNFWQYDPATNGWLKKADAGGGLRWLGSGFAINGKGYVGLGSGAGAFYSRDDLWQYTPE